MLSRANDPGASSACKPLFAACAERDPLSLLAYAQALTEKEKFHEAAHQLRLALAQQVPYPFFARAERIIEKIANQNLPFVRQTRIAVLATSTTSLLVPILRAFSLRDCIHAEFYEGIYGAMTQEILDPESGLSKFRPQLVILMQNWRDLSLPALSSNEDAAITQVVEAQKGLWQRLEKEFGCHVVQHSFDYPSEEPHGYLARSVSGGRSRVITAINTRMQEEAPSYVSILDATAVQRRIGERWDDPTLWCTFKQHPSTEALPALAEMQQSHVRAVLGLTRKVLVTDLDNTLWKGVIGEDGLEGIKIGPDTPVGQAYQQLQKYLLDLKSRGILLAVCSKNDSREARLAFEKHEHMLLRLEDFAAFYANWDDKAENLRRIAEKLSLGLDSFVFLDDNPIEREWVRSQLPEVAVVDLGPSVFHWVRDLDRGNHFFSLTLTGEDLGRTEQYRAEQQREFLQAKSPSLEEFLSDLRLQASLSAVSEDNLPRVMQLVNKTNQFNVTGKRYTAEQIMQIASLPGAWTAAFHLKDRMGSYGLVGVVLCKPNSSLEEWEIDTWLISCRALGRQLERFIFDRMLEAAIERGIKKLIGTYQQTTKNGLVADLYDKLGFNRLSQNRENTMYSIEISAPHQPTATHIQYVNAVAAR